MEEDMPAGNHALHHQQSKQSKACTTMQATTEHPCELAADAFAAALAAMPMMPSEDCLPACLPADRTIMLRRTSKKLKEVVDKMRLPAVVRLSRSFWVDSRNGTVAEKLTHIFAQLATMATLLM